jgi:hypothetical protein
VHAKFVMISIRAEIVPLDASEPQFLASRANVQMGSMSTTDYTLLRYLNLILLLFFDWYCRFPGGYFI